MLARVPITQPVTFVALVVLGMTGSAANHTPYMAFAVGPGRESETCLCAEPGTRETDAG